jgi:sn-glycerol 3-phosphate transport system permease protein
VSRLRQTLVYGVLIGAGILILFPILWALSVSLMTASEAATFPPVLIPHRAQWANYTSVISQLPVARYLLNSFLVAGSITLGQIATSALGAYAFVFLRFRGQALLFALCMSTMMVPWEVTVIPNYLTVRSLGLIDTYPGLILPFLAAAFGVFLLRQTFRQLPREVAEAARMDGAGHFRFLWSIVMPLSKSSIMTLGAFTFLSSWNQYLWPLLVTNTREMRTVQIGIRFLMNEEGLQYNKIMAGVILFMIPAALMLLWGQRYLVKGLMAGAVKG